jgi:capsule polysaccharide export protein KpsE/RkpR
MNLPNTAQSKTNEIIAVMSSYDFFEQLMLKNDFTIELMAGYGWDEENNKVMIDERIYDEGEEKWLVENYNQELDKPTMQSTFKVFKEIFEVKYDSDSSFIIVSVEHFSPAFAKNLLDDIIFLTNKIFVDKVISEGEQSISYLTERYEETKLAEIRSTLSNLIQIQTQKVALANSSSESIFKIISSPIIPEEKAGPSRMIIIMLGFFIGLFMGIIFSFVKGIVKSINK